MNFKIFFISIVLISSCGPNQDPIRKQPEQGAELFKMDNPLFYGLNNFEGWKQDIKLTIYPGFTEHEINLIKLAIESYKREIKDIEISYMVSSDKVDRSFCELIQDNQNGIYSVPDFDMGFSAIGLANTNTNDRKEIIEGDIFISRLVLPKRFFTVVLHELGHLLGLMHVDPDYNPDSIMKASGSTGKKLSKNDKSRIQFLYSGKASPPAAFANEDDAVDDSIPACN